MESILLKYSYHEWEPSSIPTSTTPWTSIAPSVTSALEELIKSVYSKLPDATNYFDIRSYSQIFRGAEASLRVVSAQQVLATATDSSVQAYASQVIVNNTLNINDLDMELNLYKFQLDVAANAIYFAIFTLVFLYMALLSIRSRYYWYNVTYFCGYGLEFCGWLGRILAINDVRNNNYFILQFVALTLAPAFIMAGIYFLFAQIVVIHGRLYSVLRPLWYSYFFITTDVCSLLVQAGGGASASIASKRKEDTTPGTNTIIAGITFQTFAMTVFLGFWFEFLLRLYFKHSKEIQQDTPYKKKSFKNFFLLLFNVKSVREYRSNTLEGFYNPKFKYIRERKLFGYFPLAITISVIVIYIRCVYRVVELAQGWRGYLITHEVYLMVLDALMVAIAGIIAVPFHPLWLFGKENVVKLANIRKKVDEQYDDSNEDIEELAESADLIRVAEENHQKEALSGQAEKSFQ